MKKLIAIFMILILLLSACLCVSAQNVNLIKGLGLCPDNWANASENTASTRAELCFMASKIAGSGEINACDTVFEDVTKGNIYSGYIQFLYEKGVVSGVSETEFNPEGNVNIGVATKVVLSALGYSGLAIQFGGYPDGYIQAAEMLEILKGVENYDILTQKDLCTIFENILVSMKNYEQGLLGDNLFYENSDTKGILSKMGICAYYGVLGEVKGSFAEFTVWKNYSQSQEVLLGEGTQIKADVSSVLASAYENAPVILWVDRDLKAIYIELQKKYEIHIGFSAEINGQRTENKEFQTSRLETMKLLDDETEYEFSDAVIRYNGVNKASAQYNNKLVRMITYNGDIVSADFYQLTDGGLISEITASKIIYHNGKSKNVALSNINDGEVRVYIDGRNAALNEVKAGSVFAYFRDSKGLILAVCEKIVTDELKGITKDKIYIGNRYFNRAQNLYCAKEGTDYVLSDASDLLGKEIAAYIAPNGDVCFIKATGAVVDKRKFYGVVDAYNERTFDDETDLKVYKIGDEITKEVYTINDKTNYNYVTFEDIKAACKNTQNKKDGKCVFVFEIKADNTIASVSKPEAFAGFGDECSVTVSRFENDSTPFVYINGKYVYFPNENIIAFYEKDGQMAIRNIKWGDVYGASFNGSVTVRLYGENQSSKPTLITLSGDGLNEMTPRVGYKCGFITDKRNVIGKDGEEAVEISVFSKSGAENYVVKKETGDSLPKMAYVRYQTSLLPFAEEEIVFDMNSLVELSGNPMLWAQSNGLKVGTVKELDDARLWVEEDNEIYFIHPYDCFFGKVQSNKNNQIKAISQNEIHSGDSIVYIYFGGDIKAILSVE